MAQAFFDRVKVGIASGGTGVLGLGGAATGYQSFAAAGVTNGTTVSYVIEDGASWEIGRGTYATSGTTLTRSAMLASSTGSALNVSTNAVCYIALLAEDLAGFGGPPSIAGCTDVDVSTPPTDQQALIYSGSEKKWKPGTVASSGGSSGGGSSGGSSTPAAAPAIVQSAIMAVNPGTITFTNAPTAGNLIVLFILGRSVGNPSGFVVQQSQQDNNNYIYMIATRVVQSGDGSTYTPYPSGKGTSNGSYVVAYEVSNATLNGSTFSLSVPASNSGSTDTLNTANGDLVLGSILSSTSITATFTGATADTNDAQSGQVDGEGDRGANLPFSTSATGASTAISFTPSGASTLSIATAVIVSSGNPAAVQSSSLPLASQANNSKQVNCNNSSFTQVILDTAVVDTGSNYSTSTGYFTAPVEGLYSLDLQIRFLDNSQQNAQFGFGICLVGDSNNAGFQWFMTSTEQRPCFGYNRYQYLLKGQQLQVLNYMLGNNLTIDVGNLTMTVFPVAAVAAQPITLSNVS